MFSVCNSWFSQQTKRRFQHMAEMDTHTHTQTRTSVGKTSGKLSGPVIEIKPVRKESKGGYVGVSRPAVRVQLAQTAPPILQRF